MGRPKGLFRRSRSFIACTEFTAGVTEVYDVKVLPGIRRAGMQDLFASDGYVSVETPDSVFWTKKPGDDQQQLLSQTQAIINSI